MDDYRRGGEREVTGIGRQIAAERRAAKCKTCDRSKCICRPAMTRNSAGIGRVWLPECSCRTINQINGPFVNVQVMQCANCRARQPQQVKD